MFLLTNTVNFFFFFFFLDSFNLSHNKAPISFLSKQKLNPRSIIEPLETLLVELTRTYNNLFNYI